MNKEEFLCIKNQSAQFRFTSLLFTDYEEVVYYKIIQNNQHIIVIYGFNSENKKYEFHWACNMSQTLLMYLEKRNDNEYITFVPKEWVEDFKLEGFVTYAIWNDYFASDLELYANYLEPILVNETNCREASEVTLSCFEQSRGFTGQSKEWIKQWINNLEPAVPDYARDCNVNALHLYRIMGFVSDIDGCQIDMIRL